MKSLMKHCLLGCCLMAAPASAGSQAVGVTTSLDTNVLNVGESTTLRVFAQVVPAQQAGAERIFSWYIDVLNTNGVAATANFSTMVKAASDNDPFISGNGTEDGDHRRGIYDTFLNLPGAGVLAPVELLSVPVTAIAAGMTEFSVGPGTGVPELSSDFLVAMKDASVPLTGGDYSASTVTLQVNAVQTCSLTLQIGRGSGSGGPGEPLTLSFTPCTGFDHVVEFANTLATPGTNTVWQPLPGAPHNSGSVMVTNSAQNQFFRVTATLQ